MCGICGEFRWDKVSPKPEILAKMSAQLARRGPDAQGEFFLGPIALGHRRLAVIDLSKASNQPFIDHHNHLIIVFNGAIYNYRELRGELQAKGQQFVSQGDTEVVVKAFAQWGESCVARLQGMFAFAIWNKHTETLFLARDRLGIKPLYFAKTGAFFRFGSNTQALLATDGINTDIDPLSLHYHLSLHAVVPAPRTILQGIAKLAPAHWMTVTSSGEMTSQRYWTLIARRPAIPKHEIQWLDEVQHRLRQAVVRRKHVADVPVGVLLSGGLDSSLLVGLLAESGVNDIQTFSIGFDNMPQELGDEFYYSDQVAQHFSCQHQQIRISNQELLRHLPDVVACMAEPMVSQDVIGFYCLAQQVSRSVKVVLSGQGADEVFAGYFWYSKMQQAMGTEVERFSSQYFDRNHRQYQEVVAQDYQGVDHSSQLISQLLKDSQGESFLDRVLHMDVTTLLVDDPIKRLDNMTMAWGVEARVPYVDHELVELVAQIPPPIKLKSQGKHLLKCIARGLLSDDIIDRPKAYFPVPALKYVQGEFLEFMRAILHTSACRNRGLLQQTYIDKLLASPEQYLTTLQGSELWHIALLEYWLQINVDP